MRGVNKVILVGTLGKDPEVRYMPSGGAVANVTMATSEAWRDKNTGQQQEQTEWHRVVFYGKLAEVVGEFTKKGSKIYVEGSLHTRKWQDKQTGQDKYSTEIKANSMQMLDSRNSQGGGQGGQQRQNQYGDDLPGFDNSSDFPSYEESQQQPRQQQRQRGGQRQQPQQRQAQPADDFDDDIPF